MKYVIIAAAACVTVLILSVTMKGCTFTTPTPVSQTASQECHAFGFIVSNACNQTINQGVDRRPDSSLGDVTMTVGVVLLGIAVLLVIGMSIWRKLFSQEG